MDSFASSTLGKITINGSSELRVSLSEYEGRNYIAIRLFVDARQGGDRVPTKKGVSLPVDKLPALCTVLGRAVETAKQAGLIPKP